MPNWKKVLVSGSAVSVNAVTASGNLNFFTGSINAVGAITSSRGITISRNATIGQGLTVGGGFGSTGTTISTTGAISANGALTCSTGTFPFITVTGQSGIAIVLGNGANFISDEGVLISRRADSDDADTDVKSTKYTKADSTEAGFIAFNESDLKVKEHYLLANMDKDLAVKKQYRIQIGGSTDSDDVADFQAKRVKIAVPLTASSDISSSGKIIAADAQFGVTSVHIDGAGGHVSASGNISASGFIGDLTGTASFVSSIAGAGITNGKFLVGNGSGLATEVNMSGDATMNNAGALTLGNGVVEHVMLAGDAVDGDNLADNAVDSEHYTDGSIDTAHIADNQVTLAKMAGLARGKIIAGDSSGDPAALALGSANTVLQSDGTDLSYGTIAAGMIASNAVTTAKINADAVTGAKIADNAINSEHYTDASIDNAHLADNAVGTDEIADDAVTGAKIEDNPTIAGNLTVNGTTTLGNATTDTVEIAGNITASGQISASGGYLGKDITLRSLANNVKPIQINNVDGTRQHEVHIDANQHTELELFKAGTSKVIFQTYWPNKIDNDAYESKGGLILGSDVGITDNAGYGLYVSAGPDSGSIFAPGLISGSTIHMTSHITASGNISASGNVTASNIAVDEYIHHKGDNTYIRFLPDRIIAVASNNTVLNLNVGGDLVEFGHTGKPSVVKGSTVTLTGNVTASGEISASLGFVGDLVGTSSFANAVAADAITGASIADNAINSEHYTDASIDNAHLADNAVDTAEIADNAVTTDKLAGIARGKIIIGNSSDNPALLAAGGANTVLQSDGTDLSYGTIATDMIANDAVTGAKIEDNPTIAGNLTVNGTTALGNATTDTVTIAGNITASNMTGSNIDLSGDLDFIATTANISLNGSSAMLFQSTQTIFNQDLRTGDGKGIKFGAGSDYRITHAGTGAGETKMVIKEATTSRWTYGIGGHLTGSSNVNLWLGNGGEFIGPSAFIGNITASANISASGFIGNLTGTASFVAADAITGASIADNAIDSEHYTDASIDAAHLASNAVTTAKINGDAVTGAKIADNAINSEHYTDASIDNAHLADNAVDTAEIADNAVTLAKMAGLARGKIIAGDSSGDPAALAVGSANTVLQSDGTDITYNTVATAMIADNAVSLAKMAGLARGKIIAGDSSGDPAALALGSANTVLQSDGTDLSYGTITAGMIASNAVETAKINADAVTGAKIADDAINSEHYTDGSIDTAHIANDAVTGAKIENNPTIAGNLTVNGTTTLGNASTDTIEIAGNITASAAISMSSTGHIQTPDIKGKGAGATQLNVQGQITASGTISASGAISGPAGYRIFSKTGTTDGEGQGDIVHFGTTTSMTAGDIYHWKSDGTWELADCNAAANCDGLLGVALGGSSAVDGVLLRGTVTLHTIDGSEAVGDVLYLSEDNTGHANVAAPGGNGDIVRVIGYCLDASNGQIWFDPDKTFVEVTA